MNKLARYIILGTGLAIVVFLLWYFSSIVAYILISAVLSLVGKPIVDFVCRLRVRRWLMPRWFGAAVGLLCLWLVFIMFFRLLIPLAVSQMNELSTIDVQSMVIGFSEPLLNIEAFLRTYLPASAQDFSIQQMLVSKLNSVLNVGVIQNLFASTASLLGNVVMSSFSISFITFFFLKDEGLFFKGVLLLFPERFENNISKALGSTTSLLRRYFIGIMLQSLGILILDTTGLFLIGISFHTAVVIGLLRGVLNVIPYVGPIIGTVLGVIIGMASNLHLDFSSELMPLVLYMLLVLIAVQLIDNIIFQPLIYSSSVRAHPLEIFIILLIAGNIGGILGMLLAIPGYTVLRVFAKEFFNKFRVVQKLTENI